MFGAKIVTLLLLVGSIVADQQVKFENHQVFSVNVKSQQQLEALRQLEQSGADGINFWQSASFVGGRSDVMVSPEQMNTFSELKQKFNLESRVMVENVQELIDNEKPSSRASRLEWTSYHTLETIYEWLDEQLLAYPSILTGYEVGQSYENRTIRAVRLSHKAGNPIVFIEANIHAREWVTSATTTWFLNQLLTSTDPAVQDLAQNVDWVIVPVFNVDGFVYSHKTNRLWRKTRTQWSHLCYGADANRNFDHQWMSVGSSDNVCADTFAGPYPMSEVESQALATFIESFDGQIQIYLAFHSYSQMVLFPWGYTSDPVDNYDVQNAIGLKAQAAFAARYGTAYKVGPSATTIYPTSGDTVDWVYATQNIKVVYTIEFRDLGRYGFLLPTDQIIPNSEETLDALIAIVKESRAQNVL